MEGRYCKESIGWPYYTGLYKIMYIIIIMSWKVGIVKSL